MNRKKKGLSILLLIVFAFLFVNYGEDLFGKMQNVETINDVANTNDEVKIMLDNMYM